MRVSGDIQWWSGEWEDAVFANNLADLCFEFGNAAVSGFAFFEEAVDLYACFERLTDDFRITAQDDFLQCERFQFLWFFSHSYDV